MMRRNDAKQYIFANIMGFSCQNIHTICLFDDIFMPKNHKIDIGERMQFYHYKGIFMLKNRLIFKLTPYHHINLVFFAI